MATPIWICNIERSDSADSLCGKSNCLLLAYAHSDTFPYHIDLSRLVRTHHARAAMPWPQDAVSESMRHSKRVMICICNPISSKVTNLKDIQAVVRGVASSNITTKQYVLHRSG